MKSGNLNFLEPSGPLQACNGTALPCQKQKGIYACDRTWLLTYLLTYLLTPWSRVFLEKLTGSQSVKKLPEFYGTRGFITAFTTARHLSLS